MPGAHFFVPPLPAESSLVVLSEEDSHHALRALRLRTGEPVTVSDGEGRVGSGTLVKTEQGRAVIEVREVREVHRPPPAVSVVVTPPKGERLRWMVQKLTEIGVDSVWLTEGERSVRTLEGDRAAASIRRLTAVAREAAMQSRQPFLTEVGVRRGGTPGITLPADAGAPVIVLHLESERRLGAVLPGEAPSSVTVVVGPEGGFSNREIEAARGAGADLASLGPAVLRTETAAVIGAALVLARYGRVG
jgi:16S rRNA (uracil1498-N3)-methyltransferase